MPTVYHRDQAGAPTFPFNTTVSNSAHFNAIKTILKACLVTGYGAYPAAGWSLIAEGDLYLVLRNGTGSGYVCFSRSSAAAQNFSIWLSETFSGMSGSVMTGVGLKSGAAASNAVPQMSGTGLAAYSSDRTSWWIVADAKTFIMQTAGNETAPLPLGGDTSRCLLYVGEDSAGNMISVGGRETNSTGSESGFSAARGMTALKDPSTGLLVDTGSITAVTPGLDIGASTAASLTLSAPIDEIAMARVYWYAGNPAAKAGYLRGVALPAQLSFYLSSNIAAVLGVPDFASRLVNTQFNLGDSNVWFLGLTSYTQSPSRFITNAPEFWS